MKTLSILDSGYLGNNCANLSGHSIYDVIRDSEGVQIKSISYLPSPATPLLPPIEFDQDHGDSRDDRRREVEKQRVLNTADAFGVNYNDINTAFDEEVDVIVIITRPDDYRNAIVHLALDYTKQVVIVPAYFSERVKYKNLFEDIPMERRDHVLLWLPYRYSRGITGARERLQSKTLAAIQMCVCCGSYNPVLFFNEFCLPGIDALALFAGAITDINIHVSNPDGRYLLSFTAIHGTTSRSPQSTGLLTTAGSGFRDVDHYRMRLFTAGQEELEITSGFTHFVHRKSGSGGYHEVTGESHDPANHLNGSTQLFHNIIHNDWEDEEIKPTLGQFEPTQQLLDAFTKAWEDFETTDKENT